jgi:hypothetical protein
MLKVEEIVTSPTENMYSNTKVAVECKKGSPTHQPPNVEFDGKNTTTLEN